MLQDVHSVSTSRETTRHDMGMSGLLVSLVDGDHIEEAHFGFPQTVHVGRQQETHPGAQKARQHWPEKEVDFTLQFSHEFTTERTESPKRTQKYLSNKQDMQMST